MHGADILVDADIRVQSCDRVLRFQRRKYNEMPRRSRLRSFAGHLERLEPRQLLAGDLYGSVIINEIMTANVESLQTRTRTSPTRSFRGAQTSPDWIELRNLSNETLDLAGASQLLDLPHLDMAPCLERLRAARLGVAAR